MRMTGSHPEDFSPYLDGDTSDFRYLELKRHLDSCPACANEIKEWQSFEAACKTPEFELEVPPFQWQRIQSRLEQENPEPASFKRWIGWLLRPQILYRGAMASLLGLVFLYSGFEYRLYVKTNQMKDLAAFSALEHARLQAAYNPFSDLTNDSYSQNPFAEIQKTEGNNPFGNH
jgi:hypothetical protein